MAHIIIALDNPDLEEARKIVRETFGMVWGYKIGPKLFYPNWQNELFRSEVWTASKHLFLDMKFHDTPDTVRGAIDGVKIMEPALITIHSLGGYKMMEAAVNQRDVTFSTGFYKPAIIAVTILTSMNAKVWERTINIPMEYVFENLLDEIVNSRIDGIVCSGKELPIVKSKYPDLITVVPGIRMPNDPKDDQSRTVTPREAVDAGADYLVIGRSVTKAKNPGDAMKKILDSL